MTPAMRALLKACIEADRDVRSRLAAGCKDTHPDWRGVEVGNACTPFKTRTAEALQDYGMIELVNLRGNNGYAFLGRYNLYDEVEL